MNSALNIKMPSNINKNLNAQCNKEDKKNLFQLRCATHIC